MEYRAKSLGDALRQSVAKWGDKPAMLYPSGKEFLPISYTDLAKRVRSYCGVLRGLGLERGDRVALQSESCVEWALLDWSCQCLGICLVPIYPTLPPDQTQYIVHDSGAKVVVASNDEQAKKTQDMPGLQHLLLKGTPESLAGRAEANPDAMSETDWNAAIDQVSTDDIATFIYTSGTTGNPKGAVLAHRTFMAVCEGAMQGLPIDHRDTFLTYLPMSHVLERIAGQALPIYAGATIGYAKSLVSLASDMQIVKPTLLLCVPRFLEAMRQRILDAMEDAPPVRKKLFFAALSQGLKKSQGKFAPMAGILDGIVGKKIRERTGGRLRFFVSGGAALPAQIAEFFAAFNMTILQGYGLTETGGGNVCNHPDRNKYWTVGEPLPGLEIKIANDGEVLLRGDYVMLGYHNLPEATAEAIDQEGWFHTGDIGEMEGTHLKITDRKKDILVLGNGKNVAPQPIENKIRESEWIKEAVLFGDGSEYVYALIVPDFERIRHDMEHQGLKAPEDDEMIHLEPVKQRIKEEMSRVNKSLADFEKIKKHALIAAHFSIESGELTPTLKVKRKVIRERYADVLATLK